MSVHKCEIMKKKNKDYYNHEGFQAVYITGFEFELSNRENCTITIEIEYCPFCGVKVE